MSPRYTRPATDAASAALRRLHTRIGCQIHDERRRRRWGLRELAERSRLSLTAVHDVEAGEPASLDAYVRVATALGLRLEFEVTDPRRRTDRPPRTADLVHSAMGELEVRHLRSFGRPVALDEPYQHYQFAGRADLVSWDLPARALLHLENRTRFPDFQETAGAYNAKRAYLGEALAVRLRIPGWRSETHVIVTLWSAEVLHALRLRAASFRALCPDPPDSFAAWWAGELPTTAGRTSALIVLDPLAVGRQRPFIGLDDALVAHPRHRGYAEVASLLAGG